jgi:hypothetical protein
VDPTVDRLDWKCTTLMDDILATVVGWFPRRMEQEAPLRRDVREQSRPADAELQREAVASVGC